MVTDEQVRRLRQLSNTEKNQEIAASKAGMDPTTPRYKLIDAVAGKRFYRRWTEQTLEALAQAAARERSAI